MSSQQKPTPSLILWDLLLTGEEPQMSKTNPELTPVNRKKLEEAGLIKLDKRGRATHIETTDASWDRDRAFAELKVAGSRSPYASTVLQRVLDRVEHLLRSKDISLVEFIRGDEYVSTDSRERANVSSGELADEIQEAYAKVSEGRYNVRVRLSELREHLDEFSRADIDRVLGEMELDESLVLMEIDDPQDIEDEDRKAAVDVGGQKRHIVYMKG